MQGIFNLSDVTFTLDELKVLVLGLKYAPDRDLNKYDIFIDFQKFMRKINIKKHFSRATPQLEQEVPYFNHTNLRNNLVFNPINPNSHFSEVFKTLVQQDLDEIQIKPSRHKNEVERGIKSLEKIKQIVIGGMTKGEDWSSSTNLTSRT